MKRIRQELEYTSFYYCREILKFVVSRKYYPTIYFFYIILNKYLKVRSKFFYLFQIDLSKF